MLHIVNGRMLVILRLGDQGATRRMEMVMVVQASDVWIKDFKRKKLSQSLPNSPSLSCKEALKFTRNYNEISHATLRDYVGQLNVLHALRTLETFIYEQRRFIATLS